MRASVDPFPGVPFGRLYPRKQGSYSTPIYNDLGLAASRFRGRPVATSAGPLYSVNGDAATITIVGNLVNRGAWTGARAGLTSYEGIGLQVAAALADPAVRSIVLDIDSPGGEAAGAFEAGAMIRAASARKPVTAVVNGIAASAGYALASGATRILVGMSSAVGSIGILAVHVDRSGALAKAGIMPTLIHAGARKVDRSSMQPLSGAARTGLQAEVDGLYGLFIDLVARHRGLSAAAVRATEAGMFTGVAAVKAKLADAVGTIDDALRPAPAGALLLSQKATSMSTPAFPPPVDPTRLASIMALPEARGFEAAANRLAASTQTVEQVRVELSGMKAAAAQARQIAVNATWADALAGLPGQQKAAAATADAEEQQAPAASGLSHGWGDVVASLNRPRGG